MRKLRLREVAVLASRWQGQSVNLGVSDVKPEELSPLHDVSPSSVIWRRPATFRSGAFILRLGPVWHEEGRPCTGVARIALCRGVQ